MAAALIPVAIALGSNLGDRRAHLTWAVEQLADLVAGIRVSSFHETEPVDVPDAQPRYLNAAVAGLVGLDPETLLARLLELERLRGRERLSFHAARTLDLDLVLYGDRVIDRPGLRVPHPRFRERAFVLEPLAEVAADWRDPETGQSVAALLEDLRRRS